MVINSFRRTICNLHNQLYQKVKGGNYIRICKALSLADSKLKPKPDTEYQ